MYKIDLLRQIEANTRGGALSDCYFAPDLWRMIERNTRVPFVPTKNWRVNYTGQGYVEIPEWKGVAGDVVEFRCVGDHYDSSIAIDSSVDRIYVIVRPSGQVETSANVDLYINGQFHQDLTYYFKIGVIYDVKLVLKSAGGLTTIGARYTHSNGWDGSITNLKLTKADGSDNRFYESIIKSDTKPTTLTLVDSLSNVRADSEFINASTYPSHYAPITKNRLQWKNGSTDGKLINFPAGEEWTEILND